MLRRGSAKNVFGGGAGDELPERAALGSRVRKVIDAGIVDLVTGFRIAEFRHDAEFRVLPDTGVCGGAGGFDDAGGSCCAAPSTLQIGARPVTVG